MDTTELESGIGRAVGFLLAQQEAAGWWRDFHTHAGASDSWVTAYVACVLAELPDRSARQAATRAWEALLSRRPRQPGWGYNASVPIDRDSTLWAVLLAHRLGRKEDARLRRAERWLRAARIQGGLATYAPSSTPGLRRRLQLDPGGSMRGWMQPQACVTAAGAQLPALRNDPRLMRYLLARQQPAGHWISYWWITPAYATAFAAAALQDATGARARVARTRALRWLSESLARLLDRNREFIRSADLFELGLLLWALPPETWGPVAGRALQEALFIQQTSGGWLGGARLRIPPPDVRKPQAYDAWSPYRQGCGAVVLDQHALFTTATLLRALNHRLWSLKNASRLPSGHA